MELAPSPAAATSPAIVDTTSAVVASSSTSLLLLDSSTGVGGVDDDCGDPSPVLDSAGAVSALSALGPASVAPADESKAGGGSVTLVTLDTLGAGVKAVFSWPASSGSPPPLSVWV